MSRRPSVCRVWQKVSCFQRVVVRSRSAVVGVVLLAGLGGCAPVRAWERGALAHRCMQAAPQPSRALLREHVMSVRESAQGGLGGAGAGCGCD